MRSVAFTNMTTQPVDICNGVGYSLKRLNPGKSYTLNVSDHGIWLYFKAVADNVVTDTYTYWNGQFTIDGKGIRSKDGTVHFKKWRYSVLNLENAGKVAQIASLVIKKK